MTSIRSVTPTPDTLASELLALNPTFGCVELNVPCTELIKRLRVLTVALLPVEVDPKSINDPTSRIITPKVISAYIAAGGDLVEAVCLSK